jgi:hypothetical protein
MKVGCNDEHNALYYFKLYFFSLHALNVCQPLQVAAAALKYITPEAGSTIMASTPACSLRRMPPGLPLLPLFLAALSC